MMNIERAVIYFVGFGLGVLIFAVSAYVMLATYHEFFL